ncbi:S-adenosyl-L-homocysteine hydrolase [Indibacter alkaliphilus LW1]|jgi:hypothetical protein|uniref:S-adenosyl-L-homocysteine hydrolase n=1 Tax=Indibacter alkaliphilus (strain CCUG 57479 / KCTC 22604 / LW1) TaxID=1189612 RepID=S2DFH7_INDAL|nr:hypothetical protein [Indibacter alkaliphilus]EOZ95805.1 S-adenosyl-L-homocysteine hydrolase [Indibacter alkaliphilus LW1]
MNYSRLLILIPFLFFSCFGDIERDITTDLQVEGREIFNISMALDESLAFAFKSFEAYSKADTSEVLGCPNIFIDKEQKKITLEFLGNRQCVNEINLSRLGKIHISYTSQSTFNAVTLEYDNYTSRGNTIEGQREFRQSRISNGLNSNTRTETFTELLIIDEHGSSTKINGQFEHSISMLNSVATDITSNGSLEGRNITGRPIRMNRTQPKRYSFNCLNGGFVVPRQGSETWQIFRHTSQATSHQAVYESEIDCQSKVTLTLHDGRTIIYRQ